MWPGLFHGTEHLKTEQLCKSSLHSLNLHIPLDRARRALHAGTLFAGIGLGSALAILRLHVYAEVSFFEKPGLQCRNCVNFLEYLGQRTAGCHSSWPENCGMPLILARELWDATHLGQRTVGCHSSWPENCGMPLILARELSMPLILARELSERNLSSAVMVNHVNLTVRLSC